MTATAAAGVATPLALGSQNRTDADLASLEGLADGAYTLSVTAQDLGQNSTSVQVPFILDSTPPTALLLSPAPLAVLAKGPAPVDVVGTATDANFQSDLLSYGPGPSPAYFVDIATGTKAGMGLHLGPWAVSSLPDGVYTLRLQATDLANQTSEARARRRAISSPPGHPS